MTETLTLPGGARIAYEKIRGKSPGVMFLGGFASDMSGTKASALAAHFKEAGRAFVRFDYVGHGESSGKFEEGTIGSWARDAVAVLDGAAEGPQVIRHIFSKPHLRNGCYTLCSHYGC